jgi:hypothetical protein
MKHWTRFDLALVSAGVLLSTLSALLPFVVYVVVHGVALVVFVTVSLESRWPRRG